MQQQNMLMRVLSSKNTIFSSVLLILTTYLLFNTGLVADDFGLILHFKNKGFTEILTPHGYLHIPGIHYIFFINYFWLSHFMNPIVLNLFKITYIFLALYFTQLFFSIYMNPRAALLASFLFIFFPTHDSTAYWYFGQYLALTISIYLYSFYLLYHDRLLAGLVAAIIASFLSYGSPPAALALSILFLLNKEFKKGALILIPNILFCIYYVVLVKILPLSLYTRLPAKINFMAVLKLYALQICTFFDATLGPSMWLKIYYSFFQLSAKSLIIGGLISLFLYKACNAHERGAQEVIGEGSNQRGCGSGCNPKLVISLIVLTLSSFILFAVNGMYPQLAFGLGNRTTIYGSLLIAYLIIVLPKSDKTRMLITVVVIFSALGVSDHWKSWNIHQQKVISQIRNNQQLRNYREDEPIYVAGNQYSKYGPLSHIEFLSETGVTLPVFRLALERNDILAETFNKRYKYVNGILLDTKYNLKNRIREYINVYDSERDVLFRLNAEEINSYLDKLPPDNRHWIQIFKVGFIKDVVLRLMPRLKYAL